ncbi:hypothetical protein BH23ACT5_BH23ACT5_23740 [soil metagenome]
MRSLLKTAAWIGAVAAALAFLIAVGAYLWAALD